MHRLKERRNIHRLSQASTNSFRDSLNKTSLSLLLSVINTKNVLPLRLSLEDLLDHTSQISYMHSGHVVLTFANDGKSFRVL